ncbi:hydroxyacylglutathione hydrolase, mitochondrial-like [Clavelina lepadiformis]|uniref:hydroxyacylglutathione hydrolase n=1 Tax=Clavelina lepadiformis TaxID=159417 RepID=A0ABP0GXX0_CLALP
MVKIVFDIAKRLLTYHSKPFNSYLKNMRVKIVPALEDNYMYLLVDETTNEAAAVDPVEPDKIIKAAADEGVKLTTVLTTHHHWDHAGGNEDIIAKVKGLTVYGGDTRIAGVTTPLAHDFCFKIGSLSVRSLFTPCHTSGHICYFVESNEEPAAVFTGDTLFLAGCGKFFEGTPSEMYHALVNILSKLPSNTKVYCGHEYSVSNLKYAKFAEPDNPSVQNKLQWAMKQRMENLPTIPSTIGEELEYNPFMRVNDPVVQRRCHTSDGIKTMGFLRNEKDNFKPKV